METAPQQPSPQARCASFEDCADCPIKGLQEESERTIWRGVVTRTLEGFESRGEGLGVPLWLATGLAEENEVCRYGVEVETKAAGALAATACLRRRLGPDFKQLQDKLV